MTPFQLEDMYHSGSLPLITSDTAEAVDKPKDAQHVNKAKDSPKPLSSLRAVDLPDIPATLSNVLNLGTTLPLDNL